MTADQLYSLTLLIALSAASLGAAGVLSLLWRWRSRVLSTVAWTAGVATLAFGLLSLGVHLAYGHRPGTAEALGPVAFFQVHPAYVVVFLVGAVAVVAGRRWRPDRGHSSRDTTDRPVESRRRSRPSS